MPRSAGLIELVVADERNLVGPTQPLGKEVASVKVTATVRFDESVSPVRGRRRRPRARIEVVERDIAEVSLAAAPVAFEICDGGRPTQVRFFAGRCWQVLLPDGGPPIKAVQRARVSARYSVLGSSADTRESVYAQVPVTQEMFIGGVLHHVVGEPRYLVSAAGPPGSGTALLVTQRPPGSVPRWFCRRADAFEEALELAASTARARGEEASVVALAKLSTPLITVLCPDAVSDLDPGVEPPVGQTRASLAS